MVRFDGSRLYPKRVSDTFSYDLTQGAVSEQTLYDETTDYIQTFYNRARILNRSAARLAMSVFQRRLASSTYALLRSFERRLAKLDGLIADIQSGRLTPEELSARQRRLDVPDVLDEKTADEETADGGREENEAAEDLALGGVVAVSLAELQAERLRVQLLLELARRVEDKGDESKFDKLREVLRDERFRDEKVLIFTEHRDTLEFLVRRLEGMGFASQVAQVHGGMDYKQRTEQIDFFRKPVPEGGARYLAATDAAGEGLNMRFCWLMVNYDIPWNPARLEQRMGRIHRYGQKHDPVFIANLVAGKTREGRVLKTLLDKLERIRRELGSDKVFDVVGRLFEGVSLRAYMEQALTEDGADAIRRRLEGTLTKEQVAALAEREKRLYGDGGDVLGRLDAEAAQIERERWRRLLAGYVRRFVSRSAPLLGLDIEGGLDGFVRLDAARAGDTKAQGDLTKVKNRQRSLEARNQAALALLRREPGLIAAGEVTFLADALAVPSADPEDRKRHDADVEAVAVKVAWAHEEAAGARVQDVSTAPLAVRAGLAEHPGFDLLADRPAEGRRAIEVKGRAGVGDVELTENEWVQACNHRDRYWLYVVFDCASPSPQLMRVQDPFGKLIVKAKGSVMIAASAILSAATP